MLSKAQIKHIRSLSIQKYRKEHNQFVAEGEKIANEWLKTDTPIHMIIATEEWTSKNTALISKHQEASLHIVKENILSAASSLKNANKVLLIIPFAVNKKTIPIDEWAIALDGIQDPGNMGSIIRISDWFGIKNIVCSPDCVDVYNPKVIQAAMGSHLRVDFFEESLSDYLQMIKIPSFAAVLDGKTVYEMKRMDKAVLLIGNEGKGISEQLISMATHKVTIPSSGGAESLNAAISTGILCALLHGS